MSKQSFPPPISEAAMTEFKSKKQFILEESVNRMLENEEVLHTFGPNSRNIMNTGLGHMMSTLESVMLVGDESLLSDQLAWVAGRLPHDGVTPAHVIQDLAIFEGVVREHLSAATGDEVSSYITSMRNYLQNI